MFEARTQANRFNPFTDVLTSYPSQDDVYIVPITAPYFIYLREIPTPEPLCRVEIIGYTETLNPTPGFGEYCVDYTYGTGRVLFAATAAGQTVRARYRGIGSVLSATDFNTMYARDPALAWETGHAAFDWRGTHFACASIPFNLHTPPIIPTTSSTFTEGTIPAWYPPGGLNWYCPNTPTYLDEQQATRWGQDHFWSAGFSLSHATSISRGYRPWFFSKDFKYRADIDGVGVLHARFRTPTATCVGAFFLYWGRQHSHALFYNQFYPGYGMGSSWYGIFEPTYPLAITTPAMLVVDEPFPRIWDCSPVFVSTLVSTFTRTRLGTLVNTTNLQVSYPGWSTLPCGFGRTSAGTYYFCTYSRLGTKDSTNPVTPGAATDPSRVWPTRSSSYVFLRGINESSPTLSVYNTSILGWCSRIGGPEGIDSDSTTISSTSSGPSPDEYWGAKYPPWSANTLGGYVTLLSSALFAKGVGAWYDITVELSPSEASCYVDDILVAVHTTHIPFFDHPYYHFEWVGVVGTWHPSSTAFPSVIDVDSYFVGRRTSPAFLGDDINLHQGPDQIPGAATWKPPVFRVPFTIDNWLRGLL